MLYLNARTLLAVYIHPMFCLLRITFYFNKYEILLFYLTIAAGNLFCDLHLNRDKISQKNIYTNI